MINRKVVAVQTITRGTRGVRENHLVGWKRRRSQRDKGMGVFVINRLPGKLLREFPTVLRRGGE